jgi:hypothetical protein
VNKRESAYRIADAIPTPWFCSRRGCDIRRATGIYLGAGLVGEGECWAAGDAEGG